MQMAYRACRFSLNPSELETVKNDLQVQLNQIYHLVSLSQNTADEEIKTEIEIRIQNLRKRFIYLLAAKTESRTILDFSLRIYY